MKVKDQIKFGEEYTYTVNKYFDDGYYLYNGVGSNDDIFIELQLNKESFTENVLGYCGTGDFPVCKTLKDLEKLTNALQQKITLQQITSQQQFPLPTKWYIEITEKNQSILDKWRKSVATSHVSRNINPGEFVLSKHRNDQSCLWASDDESFLLELHPGYVKINLETFLQITQMKNHTVTREQFQQGYELACSDWKVKLMDEVGVKLVLNDTVEVSGELVESLRRAASNSTQKSFIETLFGNSKSINSHDLEIGEAMRVSELGCWDGCIVLRTYSGFVDINNPRSTWSDCGPNFDGVKVQLEITVKD